MNIIEYENIKSLSYDQYCEFLKNKNGKVLGAYFKNQYTKNNSIIKKGFEVHHILENKVPNLSNPLYSIQFPSLYQEPDNLLYCDMFEHYLLHILIVEEIENVTDISDEIKTIIKENSQKYYKLKDKMLGRTRGTYLRKLTSLHSLRGRLLSNELIVPGINGVVYIERRLPIDNNILDSELLAVLKERAANAKERLKFLIYKSIKSGCIKEKDCRSILDVLSM